MSATAYRYCVNVCLLILAAGVITAITLSSFTYQKTTTISDFSSETDFEPEPSPLHSLNVVEDFNSVNAIPCTNKTLGTLPRTFTGKTRVASTCPQTDNPCSEFFCQSNGYCREQAISGGECFSDFTCGSDSFCNSTTCTCDTRPIPPECSVDEDCQQILGNPCLETKCIAEQCVTNLTAGAECSSTTGCSDSLSCNSTCMCDTISVVSTCVADSDCQQLNLPCAESRCNTTSNQCYIDLLPGAECFASTQCNSGFSCNQTCLCELITESAGCLLDSDCQADNSNPCVEAKCIMNSCSVELIAGAACSSPTQCSGGGFTCNSTCQCTPVMVSTGCTVDGDCQADNTNPCVEAKCVLNECQTNLIAGATCSSTTQCSTGSTCNTTCMCEAFTSSTTFLDSEFTLQDQTNPLSLAMFSTVSGNDGPLVYQLPNAISSTLAYTFGTQLNNNIIANTRPWFTSFTAIRRVIRVQNMITLFISSNYHTADSGPNSVIYAGAVPAGYRPPFLVTGITVTVLNNANTGGLFTVDTSGNVAFYSNLAAAPFPSGNIQGHQPLMVSWIDD